MASWVLLHIALVEGILHLERRSSRTAAKQAYYRAFLHMDSPQGLPLEAIYCLPKKAKVERNPTGSTWMARPD